MTELQCCATHIREQAASYCESSKVPGFVAGVYHGGATTVVAHGRGQQRHGRADARQQRGIVTRLPFDAHVEYAIYVLAHWIYSEGAYQGGLPRERLTRFMTDFLLRKRFKEEADAENAADRFIEFCTGRAWVLSDIGAEADQELYGFTHRTFLEYFAAKQLVRLHSSAQSLFTILMPRIRAAEWDMVAQLAVQILGKEVDDGADDFLQLLIDATDQDQSPEQRRRLCSFAARALGYVVPRPDVVRQICQMAIRMITTADDGDGRG
jgi:hypothetical protein